MKFKAILFLGLAALILGILFVQLKPESAQTSSTSATETTSAVAVIAQTHEHAYSFEITKGVKTVGPDVMSVNEGDGVTLTLQSDHADELHVHGYDLHAHIKSDAPAVLRFTASRSGRFTMELHHSNLEIGALEVLPR